MKVFAIVLNWNGRSYIADTLDSLLNINCKNIEYEIVVVDNNSSDDSVDFIKSNYKTVHVIQNPTNMGYAAGNNQGIKYALKNMADFIWIINSDIIVDKEALKHFIDGANKYQNSSIFGCKIYFSPGYEFYKDRYTPQEKGRVIWYGGGIIDWKNVLASHRAVDQVDKGQYDYDLETDFVTGAVMFIRAGILKQLKGFDVKYCLYYEENDMCQRAVSLGSKLMFLSQPIAWHKNAQSTGLGSPLQDYFITRNRLLFGFRYAPFRSKIALAREAYRIRKSGREWQIKGVNDFIVGYFGSGSYQLK